MSSATWPVRLGFQLKALQCDGASHAMPGTGIAFLGGRVSRRERAGGRWGEFRRFGSPPHRIVPAVRVRHPSGVGRGRGILIPGLRSGAFAPP